MIVLLHWQHLIRSISTTTGTTRTVLCPPTRSSWNGHYGTAAILIPTRLQCQYQWEWEWVWYRGRHIIQRRHRLTRCLPFIPRKE